jgi:hypothetical protein
VAVVQLEGYQQLRHRTRSLDLQDFMVVLEVLVGVQIQIVPLPQRFMVYQEEERPQTTHQQVAVEAQTGFMKRERARLIALVHLLVQMASMAPVVAEAQVMRAIPQLTEQQLQTLYISEQMVELVERVRL